MKMVSSKPNAWRIAFIFCTLLLALPPALPLVSLAQTISSPAETEIRTSTPAATQPIFRLERLPVAGGAELLTIFGRLNGLSGENHLSAEVPLVSILRDTLGDNNVANDRLRYVWMLTYTKPSFGQRLTSAVPFLYTRVGNKRHASENIPPPLIMDLSKADQEVWKKLFTTTLQYLLLDDLNVPVKAITRTFGRNANDYRQAHIARTLSILSLYASEAGEAFAFTPTEKTDIQARLLLSEKLFGGIVDDINFKRVAEKQTTQTRDMRGHNWELLRQRAEANALYFEPLEMPDGNATHALLWIARSELEQNQNRKFDGRFLNIANPWQDARLRNWKGYTETKYFDAENRPVEANTDGAHAVEMIPLALYGLDFPKIPVLLVDFRDQLNPKKREMSRRILEDVARNMLSLSRLDLPYFLGRSAYDFVTGRRGMDINQQSRLKNYSQLKLLLSLDSNIDPELRDLISRRLESVSLDPLENDLEAEAQLAREQYTALVAYAKRPDGLPARLERDRREEMVALKHDRKEQFLFRLAGVASFGLYTHREKSTPELQARMDTARQFAFHERFLRDAAKSSPQIEIVWNIEDVHRSLHFIAEHASEATDKTASIAAQIFAHTEDEETRELCLNSLYRINNDAARKELLVIYRDQKLDARWRARSADYLRLAVKEDQHISPDNSKAILSVVNENQ
jgi:hypothetical protein